MNLVRDLRLGGRLAMIRGGGRVLALTGDPVLRLMYRPWVDAPHRIHRELREGPQRGHGGRHGGRVPRGGA